eukprot:TRINITY_DN55001_c0_g1_i1.p1 TRINITY_DN55001_c0_g1~~TRINITY_DN55001_c0_g1_i1.p1  ORF type:complete len:286 (-),score=66.09 TRINITY_DN55001_c0_g1_i1:49-906(-)
MLRYPKGFHPPRPELLPLSRKLIAENEKQLAFLREKRFIWHEQVKFLRQLYATNAKQQKRKDTDANLVQFRAAQDALHFKQAAYRELIRRRDELLEKNAVAREALGQYKLRLMEERQQEKWIQEFAEKDRLLRRLEVESKDWVTAETLDDTIEKELRKFQGVHTVLENNLGQRPFCEDEDCQPMRNEELMAVDPSIAEAWETTFTAKSAQEKKTRVDIVGSSRRTEKAAEEEDESTPRRKLSREEREAMRVATNEKRRKMRAELGKVADKKRRRKGSKSLRQARK